jgi:hypothetical protein
VKGPVPVALPLNETASGEQPDVGMARIEGTGACALTAQIAVSNNNVRENSFLINGLDLRLNYIIVFKGLRKYSQLRAEKNFSGYPDLQMIFRCR